MLFEYTSLCTRVHCNHHAGSHWQVDQAISSAPGLHWIVGLGDSRIADDWIGHGHALGTVGASSIDLLPPVLVHTRQFFCCVLLLYACSGLPHCFAGPDHQRGHMVESQRRFVPHRLWGLLVWFGNRRSSHHAQPPSFGSRRSRSGSSPRFTS